ncbi:MAG: TonB-dependent receptor [Tannerella sp.]|jgi:TonB-linked SusC/RagA family outer membrane protein|nr:TonB-dependent receptor [Tannerella sp.]
MNFNHLFLKISFLFVCIGAANLLPAQITLRENNNVSIEDIINQIEDSSDYRFLYNKKMVDVTQKVSVSVQDEDIKSILNKVFAHTNIAYSIDGKQIILNGKGAFTDASPKKTVSGTVTDKEGEPIIGASVLEQGTNNGVSTDLDGHFTLTVNDGAVLRINYLGYIPQEIAVGNQSNFNLTLEEDTKVLSEVVVIGYGTVQRKDLTTAVSTVPVEDISERPIISAAQALQGKATGVQVIQPSGEPGGTVSVRVRGATSIEAGNEPLYVVDGIPMTSLMNINPNDIESIQILKDASSAAIYGTRGANGVVIVTTKRGTVDNRSISLNAYFGSSVLGKKIHALNTGQYKDYINDLNKYAATTLFVPDEETRYTNWTDEFFKTGHNQNYQLSFSNGTDRLQYYFSLGYVSDNGIVEKSSYDRYNFRANIDNRQTDWLKIGLNVGYAYSDGNYIYQNRSSMRSGSILSVINTPPYMQIWDENNPGQYDEFAYGSRILHPIAANAADQTYTESNFTGSLNLDFSLSKQMHYKLHFAMDETDSKSHYYLDPVANSDGRSTKGRIDESYGKNMQWLWENLLMYENRFKDLHHLSLLGGATVQQAAAEGGNVGGYDLLNDSRYLNGANIIDRDAVSSYQTEWRLVSFLGRISYDYDSRYLFSANLRADGSSKFSPGYKWGIFPSASVAWRISSEPFMKNFSSDWMSDMKLRFSWGLTGNQGGIDNYAWVTQYYLSRVEPTTVNPLPGMAVTQRNIGNKSLTWETTQQSNVGLDLSLFQTRLTFTLDAYYKYTKDMLMTVYFPAVVAPIESIQRNDGEMRNKGLEIGISSKNLTGNFRWNTDFNISFNDNQMTKTKLSTITYWASTYTTGQPAIILRDGLPLGSFYGYMAEGVDPETGDVIYKDLDNNGIINPDDRTVIGDAQPVFVGGITNTFSYANFDLSVFFQGSYGNDIFNASKIDMTAMMDFRNQSTDVLKRWKRPGMETDIPRPGKIENIYNSTRFIEDGSYLRLKSLTLSYNIPAEKGFMKQAGIAKLQPYITAQNLWTWTCYTGYDPEVNAYGSSSLELGVDYGTYPQSKAVIIGINVQF